MAGQSTAALGPGGSQIITVASGATWSRVTLSWTCSVPSDQQARAWLQGSADGTTFFPLRPGDAADPSVTGTGAVFYRDQPVTAVKVLVACSPGNTVTATVTGN